MTNSQQNDLLNEVTKLRKENKIQKEKIKKVKKTRLFFSNKYVNPATTVSDLLCSITTQLEYCDKAIDFWGSYSENTKEYNEGGYKYNEDLCFADHIMAGEDEYKQEELLERLNKVYDQSGGIEIQHFDIGDVLYSL